MTSLSVPAPASKAIEIAIAAALRADSGAVEELAALAPQAVMAAARQHGVVGLLRKSLDGAVVPLPLRAALDEEVRDDAAVGAWRREQTTRVIGGLHRAGVATLVLKGDALAHTHYPAPYLRPRRDTDIMVRKGDFKRAEAVLASLGYQRQSMVDRELVPTQCSFAFTDRGRKHFVDVHGAVSCRQLFAALTTFDELSRDARPLDAFGEYARTPSPVWSLLLGCINRVAHHNDTDRLIWLYDFKLLADQLTDEEWALFWTLAANRDIVEVCRVGLTKADARFDLAPLAVRATTRRVVARRHERASECRGDQVTQMSTMRMIALDARAVRGVVRKARLVASHVLPDRRYMREVFHVQTGMGLLAAYVRRATIGAWRLIH